jgi:hypothetical protein
MPISDFPNEIFRIIFDYLPANDVLNCVFVCKSWNHLASPSNWRQVRFRFDPQNNKLASLLLQRPTTLENFRFTTHLMIDLDHSRKSNDPLRIDCSADQAVDLLHRIVANLPIRFHTLEIIFHCDAFSYTNISSILCPLLPLAERPIHGLKFVFLGSRYTSRSSEDLKDAIPFFPMLTELTVNTYLLSNVHLPPMPRLTQCKIENGLIAYKMGVFTHSPLETLSLNDVYIWGSLDLPHTITSLNLIDVHEWSLHLAFFQFPNLRNLVLDFRRARYEHSSLYAHPIQSILSTELSSYTTSAALPLWISERIGESCHDLDLIHFKSHLAKYSRNCSPFLRHFRERRQTSIINEQAKTSWEALLWGKGGNHFIFFDETFREDENWESEWQLRRSFWPPSARGDITELRVVKNEGIYMTTFSEEARKEFDSSRSWINLDIDLCSKNAEFWELIRIDVL